MRCAVCDWPTEVKVWVRPQSGGPRTHVLACDQVCKGAALTVLAAEGFTEAQIVLGWDVFRPIWERDHTQIVMEKGIVLWLHKSG